MNKLMSFVRDGESKLPPGFRFQPTDEEIVFQYLALKTFSHPLPASIIPEIVDIFSSDPWELPGNLDQDRYFFCIGENKTNQHGKFHNRSSTIARKTCNGYWKSSDSSYKQIISSKRSIPIVGIKKTLVFYKGNNHRVSKTDWFMNVYFIALSSANSTSGCNNIQHQKKNYQGSLVRIGNWMLCHVFLKKKKKKNTRAGDICDNVRLIGNSYYTEIESDDLSENSDSSYVSLSSSSSCCSNSDCSDVSEVSSDI